MIVIPLAWVEKIEVVGQHWLWRGCTQQHSQHPSLAGYPVARTGGHRVYVHREMLARKLGRPVRRGYDAHHRCPYRTCVNPGCLEELPHSVNFDLAVRCG